MGKRTMREWVSLAQQPREPSNGDYAAWRVRLEIVDTHGLDVLADKSSHVRDGHGSALLRSVRRLKGRKKRLQTRSSGE